jgi:glycine/D-amino acid oxidase-like deaminating enzyme
VSQTADVVIGGAGIIGGSVAFHLLERFAAGKLRAEANMF